MDDEQASFDSPGGSDLRCANGDVVRFLKMLCPKLLNVDSFFGLPLPYSDAVRRVRNGECLYFRAGSSEPFRSSPGPPPIPVAIGTLVLVMALFGCIFAK